MSEQQLNLFIANYIELHRKYKLDVQVCSAFWYDTPSDRQNRLKLESELINRWQSPFNRRNAREDTVGESNLC